MDQGEETTNGSAQLNQVKTSESENAQHKLDIKSDMGQHCSSLADRAPVFV